MTKPLVSIGLPVFNGEKYLHNALNDLLAQDCRDFELVICDNGSTDSTPQICAEYAAKDARIRILRSEDNLGAIRNFNKAFKRSTGRYFMWAAHDDGWHPTYLRRCIEELEKHPNAVLCASDLVFINEHGEEIETEWVFESTVGLSVEERIHSLIKRWGWYAIYGVIRPEFLRKTKLTQNLVGPDVVLLAELSLLGEFAKVPEKLFRYRFFENKTAADSVASMNPTQSKKPLTQFNTDLARDVWATIENADVEAETKKHILARVLQTIASENKKWRDAIVAENPFAIYKRAADQMPAISVRRHLYRLLSERSEKGRAVFTDAAKFEPGALISPAPLRPRMPVRWMAPIFNPSGYASEAINFILPLANRIELGIHHQNNIYSEKFVSGLLEADRASLFKMRDKFAEMRGGIVVSHQPANGFSMLPDAEYHIGRSMYETDRIPAAWVAKCNLMDEIWVPSEFNKGTFAASGVSEDKLVVIPGAVDASEFDPAKHSPLPLPNKGGTNFLSVFEWSTRKGWDVLLAAYLQEFSAEDDVCLYLRTYLMSKPDGDPSAEIWRRIKEFAATLNLVNKPWPRIEVLAEQTATADLPRLYKAVDCLVAPSRGEGWGRPHHEAMMMGVPVIATGWSGNTEFMTPENSYLLDYELEEAKRLEPELWHYQGHKWARASVPHLRNLMRRVTTNPAERAAKGARARADMIARFSREAVSEKIMTRLLEIERKLITPACPAALARSLVEEKPAEPREKLSVTWEGSFLDYGSLSHVNREFTAALANAGSLHLTRVATQAEAHPDFANLRSSIAKDTPADVDVTIRHSWPPNWNRPKRGAWIQIQPWEYGALPAEWVERLQAVSQVWTYSEYLRKVYIDSGVAPNKVKVVPLGIDAERFCPGAAPLPLPTSKKFKFLFVGGTISRKGPDVLIQSYLDAFSAEDDVCLVIKDFGANGVYAGQTCGDAIREEAKKPDAPEIIFLDDELPAEAMPSLYCACDCLVHPYRGEGFGLPVLEAMACGLPAIVTANGATEDFATDEFAYRVPSTREPIGWRVADLRLARQGWLLEPDALALTKLMRHVITHREEAREKGSRASNFVREHWTWERAAKIANSFIHELAREEKESAAAKAAKRARRLERIPMAEVGYIGSLNSAQELFAQKSYAEAWNETKAALAARPFHPKAWLLLSEIALACGDMAKARQAVEHAFHLAPEWTEAKRAQKRLQNAKGTPKNAAEFELPERSNDTRLTICLIVKNEEKFLSQALHSVKSIAYEIIVVDTGSTDGTIEIAKEFGAQVHSFKWCDDFSAARNAALKHATGDWILFLDADEELAPDAIAQLRNDLAHRKTICYRVPLVDKGRETQGRCYVPRLFRNGPGFFYFGRVHEEIFFSIEPARREFSLENRLGKALLVHHGYSNDIAKDRNKSARNLHLLELAIEDWPNQPNLLINYALELSRAGRTDEAVQHAIWAVEATFTAGETSPEFREFLLTRAAEILLGARRFQDVLNLFATPLAKANPLTASQHFLLGIAFMEKKRFEEAAAHFVHCLKKRSQATLIPAISEILKGGPNHCLARCLAQLKQTAEAEKSFRAALAEEPDSTPLRIDFAHFLRTHNQPLEALQLLCAGVEHAGSNYLFWRLGGEIALSQPEFLDFAKDWTSQAITFAADDPIIREQRAEALLLNGDIAEATNLSRKTNFRGNPKSAAALLVCESILGAPGSHPGFDEAALSHAFIEWYRKLIAANAVDSIQRLHTRLPKLAVQVPTAVRLLREAIHTAEAEMKKPVSA